MTFNNDQLQLVLNYDTNEKECLTFEDRCEMHRAISRRLTFGKPYEFSSQMSIKLVNILGEIGQSKYAMINNQYIEEKDGTKKIKNKL